MKISFFIIAALFFALNASSALSWTNEDFKLNELSKVSVTINDNTEDGCWTNLGEVQRYAEDSLRARDVNVEKFEFSDPDEKNYYFAISVIGFRLPNDACSGYVSTRLWAGDFINGTFHIVFLHNDGTLYLVPPNKNLNNKVLDFVGEILRNIK